MKFALSNIIPMPFVAVYGINEAETELAKWWQWRGHVFFYRTVRFQALCH